MNNIYIKPIVISKPSQFGDRPVPINPIPPKYPNGQNETAMPILPKPAVPSIITPMPFTPQSPFSATSIAPTQLIPPTIPSTNLPHTVMPIHQPPFDITNPIPPKLVAPIQPIPSVITPFTPVMPRSPLGTTPVSPIQPTPPIIPSPTFQPPIFPNPTQNTNLFNPNFGKPNPFSPGNTTLVTPTHQVSPTFSDNTFPKPVAPIQPIPSVITPFTPVMPKSPLGTTPVPPIQRTIPNPGFPKPITPISNGPTPTGVILPIERASVGLNGTIKDVDGPNPLIFTKATGPQPPLGHVSSERDKQDVVESKPKQIKEKAKVSFRDFEEKFENTAVEVIKERKIMKNFCKATTHYNMKKSNFTTKCVQEVLYGKSNITFIFKTDKKNVYCVAFTKFDGKPNDDAWMKDLSYRICVLYKDGKECDSEWRRQGVKDEEEGEKENQKNSYGLFSPSNTKEVIQTYCGFIIMKDKSLVWDEDFSKYYCVTKGAKTIEDKQEEEVNELIIVEWKE